ncbi:MAG: hypothetical protein CMD25_00880 [Flavobacteriales bacterium]|jgi:hypothetical protein|nr:hypothetical protein [Flavobacteriales bacterium]|tara:strand:- start:3234 stop:3578 length:345 start_codon:yes stop_codon:yes gene_type:complete
MKSSELKNLIKEAVREAIQEELKDILLEAVKTPKVSHQQITSTPVVEHQAPQQPVMSASERREAYKNILGDTAAAFSTNNVPQSFTPQPGYDSANGTLPSGEVNMSQIASLMKK